MSVAICNAERRIWLPQRLFPVIFEDQRLLDLFFGQQVESCWDDRNALCFEDSPVPGPWTEALLLNMFDESLINHTSLVRFATGKSIHG